MRDGTFGPKTLEVMGERIVVPLSPIMDVIGRYALLPAWDPRHEVVRAVRECLMDNARFVVPYR